MWRNDHRHLWMQFWVRETPGAEREMKSFEFFPNSGKKHDIIVLVWANARWQRQLHRQCWMSPDWILRRDDSETAAKTLNMPIFSYSAGFICFRIQTHWVEAKKHLSEHVLRENIYVVQFIKCLNWQPQYMSSDGPISRWYASLIIDGDISIS